AAAKTLVKGVLSAPNAERFLIVDHPSATQAHILLAQVLPAEVANDPLAAQLVVSHAFRSRLMDNLRSAKGWSYESYPFGIELRRGGAVARFNMPVQTDKTAEAIAEVRKEIARLRDEPVTPASLRGWRSYLESTLTAGLMSLERLNPLLLDAARNELPPGYYASALRRLAAFTPEDVTATARALFRPDRLVWVIAGRRDEVERELRELGVPFEVYAPQ
ncbi:MAG TPA: insulinase family protein, partial [Thermoanaerobaculia bacterium]